VCIRYHGNVSTEPLPSNDKGIFTDPLPSNDKGIFTDPLPSNDKGIFTDPLPGNDKGSFTEPLPGNDKGILPIRCLATIRGFLLIRCLETIKGFLPSRCLATLGEIRKHTHRQQRDLISPLLFLQNKGSRLKITRFYFQRTIGTKITMPKTLLNTQDVSSVRLSTQIVT
jgi:hypothetical protein